MAHHIAEDGNLEEVGQLQLSVHTLFAKYEPVILRILNWMIETDFFRGRGKPILVFMRKRLDFLPRGEVVSTQRAKDFVDALSNSGDSKIAVCPCVCQEALGRRVGILEKDITVLYGTEVYERTKGAKGGYREMSPEETKCLLEDLHEEGCMPTFYACLKSNGWMVVICNCEGKICLPNRAHQLVGGVLSPGPDIIDCDFESCSGCGRCVDRCHFGANRLVDGKIATDPGRCYGCGLCVSTCPSEARRLVERTGYTNTYYPIDFVIRFGAEAAGKGQTAFGQG
ncbi:MAG TPA: 4Fe-4S binding protein [Methanothrix sp.]|nr:4Fe-4S binding protein [Methanothrix sp.]HPJ83293.1 4Fe-4S binding protein [Methanothrix sp.]HPR66158.1 4Fe-4S binding protein [Methanothrix sp.]